VAIKKLRTFGIEWGVKKKGEKRIKLTMGGEEGKEKWVEVKDEGIMTHLGVIWNMDLHNEDQWNNINTTIEKMGEIIMRGRGRMRDKITAINYCLKSTILYRLQYCTWGIVKYQELDQTLDKIIKKVTKNMNAFPGDMLHVDVKDGGLGLRSLAEEANERKMKLIFDNINKESATGLALQGLVSRGHRYAGKGGLVGYDQVIEDTLGNTGWVTSIVQGIKEAGLGLRTNGRKEKINYAATSTEDKKKKIEINKRGIVTVEEDGEATTNVEVIARIGQCWKKGSEVIEIVGYNDKGAEIIR
jgi:hypothetical protein